MTDREKVIRGLECCTNTDMSMCLDECPYHKDGCSGGIKMMQDALALLKEQEPVEPERRELPYGMYDAVKYEYKCGACGCGLMKNEKWRANYCPECGRAVKWNDISGSD